MKRLLLTFLVVAQSVVCLAQTTIRVEAPNVVAADEQFNVTFVIEGDDSPTDFSWEQGSDFRLLWGPQTGRSTSISIVNGKQTKSVQFTYTYILSPLREGAFTLPVATAKFKGGKELKSNSIKIEVVASGSSSSSSQNNQRGGSSSSGRSGSSSSMGTISDDDLYMKFTLSRTNVVVGEPIVATLKLYQRVNIVSFEDAHFPTFNGFWSQEIETPTNIEFQRENVNGEIFNTAVLRKYVLIPQQSGTLTIEPAELVCLVNVRVSSGGTSILDAFFDDQRTLRKRIFSKAQTVKVSPLPSGAPDSFGGGVGEFSMSAALSKDSFATHEAVSLVVTIKGKGNVSLLEAPKVSFPPDMEVYDTKVSDNLDKGVGGTSGSKIFEYPFIPRSHGDFEIPPVRYTYYDVNAGKYVTLSTPPITYHVEKGKDNTSSSGGGVVTGVDRSGVRSLNQDIRFIYTKMPQLASKGNFFVFSTGFIAIVVVLLLVALVLWLLFRRIYARRADVVGTKNRRANKVALKRLKLAGDFLKQNLYTAFYEELHKALVGYISDKLNISMTDLSKENVSLQLTQGGVPAETVERFTGLLDACEFARYSPDAGNAVMAAHYDEAINVISSLEAGMKGKKSAGSGSGSGAGSAGVLALILMLALPSVVKGADTAYIDSLWNSATAAYSEGYWTDALKDYEMIASVGLEAPQLYCNIGDAYFKTGDYPHAILYYERALKLDPSYSDARYNIEIAAGFIQDRIDPVPEFMLKTWAKNLCYSLNSDAWAVLSVVFFALCLAMLLLFLLSSRPAGRRTGFFVGIVFLCLLAASLSFSLWQKSDYERADSAIVVRPVTTVKSSPSAEASTDLFILHEGTKVTILDEVGNWRNISLADGRQGWMLSSDMEVI